ncbi:MAG TPA: hypothetical protein VKX25_19585 [Bryobacteraceae bacterium]|jgi:hypothetical protein|nr:hypothetical protein [Bryobacteraceae bacterium]
MPRQLRLEPSDSCLQPTGFSSLIVTRAQIPADLSDADKQILRANLEINCEGRSFFFRDCEDVRRVLRMRSKP